MYASTTFLHSSFDSSVDNASEFDERQLIDFCAAASLGAAFIGRSLFDSGMSLAGSPFNNFSSRSIMRVFFSLANCSLPFEISSSSFLQFSIVSCNFSSDSLAYVVASEIVSMLRRISSFRLSMSLVARFSLALTPFLLGSFALLAPFLR